MPSGTSLALTVISAAVTPVVMISAAAALILGLNQKVNSISDKLRILTAEFRARETTEERRENIREQVALFERRFRHLDRGVRWLYAAVTCFIGAILIITLISHARTHWDPAALALFEMGVVLMLGAVIEELLEGRQTRRTLEMELRDVCQSSPP